jgi:hypothetical protein
MVADLIKNVKKFPVVFSKYRHVACNIKGLVNG